MSLAQIILTTNKTISNASDYVRKIGQDERGQVLTVLVTDANGVPYNLSDKKIIFSETKDSGKYVVDDGQDSQSGKFTLVDAANGKFAYTLQDQVYTESGTAWFDIANADGTVVDTTVFFKFVVIQGVPIYVNDESYSSTLSALQAHYQGVIKNAESSTQSLINSLNDKIRQAISKGQQDTDDATAGLTKQFADQMRQFNDQMSHLKTDLSSYQAKYDKLASDWATELKNISDRADDDINSKYAQKLADLQNDYNQWKAKAVADFSATVDPIRESIKHNTSDVENINKQIQSTKEAISKIEDVDFTLYIKKDDLTERYVEYPIEGSENQQLHGHDGKALSFKKPLVDCDATLSKQSLAADAYAVGRRINDLDTGLTQLNQEIYKTFDTKENAQNLKNGIAANADANRDQDSKINGLVSELENNSQTLHLLGHDWNSISSHSRSTFTAKRQFFVNDSTLTNPNGYANAKATGDAINVAYQQLSHAIGLSIANAGKIKTVNGAQPDSNGNISIAIPDISNLAGRITALEHQIGQITSTVKD